MTNTQHTPGPWELHEGGTSVNGADGHLVASCGFLPYRNVWDSRANARLMVAAPELLDYAELEDALGTVNEEEVFRKHGYEGSMMQPHSMRVFMNETRRAAIAKARGQS